MPTDRVTDTDAPVDSGALAEALAGAVPTRAAGDADTVQGVAARLVASPTSTEQVSSVLRVCHAAGATVVVRGHGTRLDWGLPPERLDVLLDLSGLDALVEHAEGDLVVTAQAGLPLRRLHELLAAASQQLVLDDLTPSDGPGATLGGVVATGACGPRRLLAGAPRDLLIGVTMVRADGTVAKSGGKVVKNVAGYDLGKLLTGSFGTLGVVTEVIFRLHPVPEAARWVQVRVPRAHVRGPLGGVVHSQLVPAAVEVDLDPEAGVDEVALAVLLTGTAAGVESRLQPLRELLATWPAEVGDEAPEWTRTYPEDDAGGGTLVKVTSVLSGVADLLDLAAELGVHLRGSAGIGVLHGAVPAGQDPAEVTTVVERLRERSQQLGGSLVVLRAPAAVRTRVDTWGPIGGLDLMRRVKHEFDPTRVLAPGRYVDAQEAHQ